MSHENWILGFAGAAWNKDYASNYDTKIGGQPTWPKGIEYIPPPCNNCSHPLVLVLQAFSPHFAHQERSVYLFACNSIICCADPDNWTAVRVVKLKENVNNVNQSNNTDSGNSVAEKEEISWSSDEEDEDNEDDNEHLLDDLRALSIKAQQMESKQNVRGPIDVKGEEIEPLSHNENPQPVAETESKQVDSKSDSAEASTALDSFYVEVSTEPTNAAENEDTLNVESLLKSYQQAEKVNANEAAKEGWGAEEEEQTILQKDALETFHRRLNRAPQQILRYNFGATPLWAHYPPPEHKSKLECACGSKLVFELQLLGSSLYYMKPDIHVRSDQSEAGLNFSSVAIYSCASDCTKAPILANSQSYKVISQTVLLQQDDW